MSVRDERISSTRMMECYGKENMCNRNPIQCIIPPYIIEHLTKSEDPQIRSRAVAHLSTAARIRTFREAAQAMPTLMATMSPSCRKDRVVYDAQQTDLLPGKVVRSEGQPPVSDVAVNDAYDLSGNAYDFYEQVFQRNSLDNNGMMLVSSVHVAEVNVTGQYVPMNNAFWTGKQMAYGDGDGSLFRRFTQSLDVVGHELTHGVQAFTSNLQYHGQSGSLIEHFADVFGILIRQWRNNETAAAGSWVVGAEILVPAPNRRGVRDMENPGTAFNDPEIGKDQQVGHFSNLYTGQIDSGGVHINSGIPNRAFVLTAQALGGNAWEVAGRIWYKTMLQLSSDSRFIDCAQLTVQIAAADFGTAATHAVRTGWEMVGISV